MKICVTGGGGPFGLNLARHALEMGHDVIGVGRSPLKGEAFTLGARRMGYRYWPYSVGPDTEFVMDLLDKEKPELIVNFAAQGEGAASFRPAKHWKHFYRTNGEALVELTEHLSTREWMRLFIQVGTSELYGSVESPAKEDAPMRPTSPYAASKAAFDLHLMSIASVLKFPGLIVRPSNCYTPGQQLHRVIPKAFLCGITGQKLPLQGGGRARKSYLDADDLSRAIMILSEKGQIGEAYNCGPYEPTSIRRLLEMCGQCMGLAFDELVEETEDRIGQDGCYHLDSSKLKALGWVQCTPLLGGLAKMHQWVNNHREELIGLPTDFRMRA
jgi:dTDP-glucose 4,6-dehydratase